MMRLINTKNKSMPEVKVMVNGKFVGWASMYEPGYIGGSENVFKLSQIRQDKILRRLMIIQANMVGA